VRRQCYSIPELYSSSQGRLESPLLQDVSHCWHSKAVEMFTQNAVTFSLRGPLGASLTAERLYSPFPISIT
jgi:hypothetical protein